MLKLSGRSNLLVEAAATLLAFATHVQRLTISTAPSKDKLMQHLTYEIRVFEDKVKHAGYSTDVVGAASYSLCSLLDEMIIYNQIGSAVQWDGYELLRSVTGESSDGKSFFVILNDAVANPASNLDLLELLYLCLSLGFEGKYRGQKKGKVAIEDCAHKIYELIQQYRGELKTNLLVQSTLPVKQVGKDAVPKKHINWGRLLVGMVVIVIGLSIYLHWNALLDKQLLARQLLIINN